MTMAEALVLLAERIAPVGATEPLPLRGAVKRFSPKTSSRSATFPRREIQRSMAMRSRSMT